MDKKYILMLGATDRFNYGDLLFPLISERFINKYANETKINVKIINCATTNSNLINYGAMPTVSFNKMFRYLREPKEFHAIVIGGGVLAVDWFTLYSMVSYPIYLLQTKKFYKSSKIKRCISKYIFERNTPFPFMLKKHDFPNLKTLIYNSVGDTYDSPLGLLPLINENADYFSVRSNADFAALSNDLKEKTEIVPDSAILMSSLWSMEYISSKLRTNFLYPKDKYVFFQINLSHLSYGLNEICNQLDEIYRKTNCKIILCSIGTALRHCDDEALTIISKKINIPVQLFLDCNIWEIMYLIANSKVYIGTSLHGLITAMSFSVPYVGFTSVKKQMNFMDTWSIDELKEPVSVNDFSERTVEILNIWDYNLMKEKIRRRTKDMQDLSILSFKKIFSIINDDKK